MTSSPNAPPTFGIDEFDMAVEEEEPLDEEAAGHLEEQYETPWESQEAESVGRNSGKSRATAQFGASAERLESRRNSNYVNDMIRMLGNFKETHLC